MSVEQWVVLALVILLPLLEGLARLRRTRVTHDRPSAQTPPSARRATPPSNRDTAIGAGETSAIPPPLPPSNASGSPEAQKRLPSPSSRTGVAQWLRPTRNLRRAMIVAAILGPRTQ